MGILIFITLLSIVLTFIIVKIINFTENLKTVAKYEEKNTKLANALLSKDIHIHNLELYISDLESYLGLE